MDPQVTIDRIRDAIREYSEANEATNPEACQGALMDCLDASTDLVEWMDKGGFIPAQSPLKS